MKRKFDAALRQYQVKEAGLENLWTNDRTWPYHNAEYDAATQTYTLPSGTPQLSHFIYTLPTRIPAGTTASMSVFIDSGRWSSTSDSSRISVIASSASSTTYSVFVDLPRDTDLTGMVLQTSVTTTEEVGRFAIGCASRANITIIEPISFRVVFSIGDTPAEAFRPYGVHKNAWIDGLKSSLPSVKMLGKTEQKTYEGKNLFAVIPDNTVNGVTLTLMNDGGYMLNGECTTSANIVTYGQLQPGTYSLSCNYEGTIPDDSNARAQVYSSESGFSLSVVNKEAKNKISVATAAAEIQVSFRIRIQAGCVYENVKLYPMLVFGEFTSDTMPEFEPYNALSPSPQYPAEIKANNATVRSLGKNILDVVNGVRVAGSVRDLTTYAIKEENGVLLNGGVQGKSAGVSLICPAVPGQYQVIFRVAATAENQNVRIISAEGFSEDFVIQGLKILAWVGNKAVEGEVVSTTVTVPEGYSYVGFSMQASAQHSFGITDVMICHATNNSTVYEPYYDGGEATAPNLMCAVDGSCQSTYDPQTGEFVNWWYDKLTFNGSEAWNAYPSYQGFFLPLALPEEMSIQNYWSNMEQPKRNSVFTDTQLVCGLGNNILYYLYHPFYDDTLKDKGLANWKAHLAEHPLEVWVARNEPEITNIGAQRLTCPTGFGQIIQVAGDIPDCPMEIKYLAHGGNVK